MVFIFYIKIIFCSKRYFEKKWFILSHFIYIFYALQDIWNAVIIHQSSYGFALGFRPHDLRTKIHINKLGTTTQIFKAIGYLILMSNKYNYFRKIQSMWQGRSRGNCTNVLRKNFSSYVYLKDISKNIK